MKHYNHSFVVSLPCLFHLFLRGILAITFSFYFLFGIASEASFAMILSISQNESRRISLSWTLQGLGKNIDLARSLRQRMFDFLIRFHWQYTWGWHAVLDSQPVHFLKEGRYIFACCDLQLFFNFLWLFFSAPQLGSAKVRLSVQIPIKKGLCFWVSLSTVSISPQIIVLFTHYYRKRK